MSRLYKPTTQKAYRIASALLLVNLDQGVVDHYCQNEGETPESTEEIKKAMKQLAESLYERGQSFMEDNHVWTIRDQKVIEAIKENGFTCKPYSPKGTLQIITQDYKDHYDINCPIKFNGQYRLKDGRILQSTGTVLILKGDQ